MSNLTGSLVDIATYLHDLVVANQATLGLADVFWGDQDRIPRTPAVAIEPDSKSRMLDGAPRRTLVEARVVLLVYHAKVQDIQVTRKQADQFAEAVETLIHTDKNLGGLVIHGMVTDLESGYAYKSGTLFRTARLIYTATSKVSLPY